MPANADAEDPFRYRDYARDSDGRGAEDLKPQPEPYIPSRAWLSRTVDRYPEDGISDPEHWEGHFEGGNEDWHFDAEGTFDELVRRAGEVGVEEYRVWSRAQNMFVVVGERPVQPVP